MPEKKWIIPDAYEKPEVVSELIWIQEFLDELIEWEWKHGVMFGQTGARAERIASNIDLAQKYSKSIDKILEFLEDK